MQRWKNDRAQGDAALPVLQREQEELLVARWHLAQGEVDAASRLLERWLDDAQAGGRTQSILEIQLLLALIQHTIEHTQEAQLLLQAVLGLTHAQGDVRLFLDEGEPVAVLLAQSVALSCCADHRRVIRAGDQSPTQSPTLDDADSPDGAVYSLHTDTRRCASATNEEGITMTSTGQLPKWLKPFNLSLPAD